MAELSKQLVDAMKQADERKTSAFDSIGTVRRVKDGIAYVHLAGGVDETPVQLTVDAKTGDEVQVRVSGGRAWIVGNATAPPTDNTMAKQAINYGKIANDAAQKATKDALVANEAAQSASASAREAKETTDEINAYAETAGKTITQILNDGETAGTAAQKAKTAADSAMKGLGQVEDVVGTLNWITAHSKVTTDTTPQAGKSYYIKNQDNTFTLVTDVEGKNPAQEGWYELSEAIQNYILSHLALTNDGLYVMKDGSQWKVLVADDGVYILDPNNKSANQMTGNGNVIGYEDETHVDIDYHSLQLADKDGITYFHVSDLRNKRGYMVDTFKTPSSPESPFTYELLYAGKSIVGVYLTESGGGEIPSHMYSFAKNLNQLTMNRVSPNTWYFVEYELDYDFFEPTAFTFGTRITPETVETKLGLRSSSFGHRNKATGVGALASGTGNDASGDWSHVLGKNCVAAGRSSASLGYGCKAKGNYSHAQNDETIAEYEAQTAIGRYNNNQSNNAFEIGNGTDDNNRSNAFEVDWSGNTTAGGDITAVGDIEDGQGNVLSDKADTSSLATVATSGDYDDLSNKPTIPPVPNDYIISTGTTSGWSWRKWKSGRMEAEKEVSTGSTWTSVAAGFYYNQVTITPPSGMLFRHGYAVPTVASVWLTGAQVQGKDSTVKLTIHRLSGASATFTYRVVLVGVTS